MRLVTYALLTRSPLSTDASICFSFDLHVLSTPPAFVLSQDQTLNIKYRTVLRLFLTRLIRASYSNLLTFLHLQFKSFSCSLLFFCMSSRRLPFRCQPCYNITTAFPCQQKLLVFQGFFQAFFSPYKSVLTLSDDSLFACPDATVV